MGVLIAVLVILAIVLFVVIGASVRIVRPYERGVVEFLGKYQSTYDPGLRLLFPFVQRMRVVDMREQVVDVAPQEVITKDNVVVSVDAVIYYEPTDPQRLTYNVANFMLAITKLAQTNVRNLVGDMQLDEALTSRDTINTHLREILDDATDKWGVKVVRVEIQRIDPPADVMHAMHEQMKAERTRRALVTQATGDREASITRAEGERQAAILQGEANKQRNILSSEGEAQAARTLADAERYRLQAVAEGQGSAIRQVFTAIHDGNPTADVLVLKYFEALQAVANGRATKVFLPSDPSGMLQQLAGLAEVVRNVPTQEGQPTAARPPVPAPAPPIPPMPRPL